MHRNAASGEGEESNAHAYISVDEAGRAVDVSAFTMAGEVPFKDRERQTLLESRFKPATCNGRPVETDFLMPEHGR